jgi:hypothetical protein
MSVASSFGFNASAVAFGGRIKSASERKTKPIQGKVPSVALAPAGGRVEQRCKGYNRDGVRFGEALTVVEGCVEDDSIYTTTVSMHLERLNVFDRVTADRIEAVITSQRGLSQKNADSVFTIDAKFTNLKVAGASVQPPLNLSLFRREIPTYRQFVEFFSQEANMEKFGRRFGWNLEDESETSPIAMIKAARAGTGLTATDPIRCSLVTDPIAGFDQDGYTLVIDDQNKVHLAEVLIKPGLRRLNMLRIEMTKPPKKRFGHFAAAGASREGIGDDEYDATFVSGEGNGSNSYPP